MSTSHCYAKSIILKGRYILSLGLHYPIGMLKRSWKCGEFLLIMLLFSLGFIISHLYLSRRSSRERVEWGQAGKDALKAGV
jgi:hypothetical protein